MTTSRSRWTIGTASNLAVVGFNPENADYDNPRGEIIREVFHLDATNEYGERRVFGLGWREAVEAENFIPLAPMVELWEESYPVYGSQAYQDTDEETNVLQWERDLEGLPAWA